jgi:hypothetical protein
MKKVILSNMTKKNKADKSKSKSIPKAKIIKTKPKLKTNITIKRTEDGNKDQRKDKDKDKKGNEGPIFYAVSQKNKWNQYNPIALLDQEGHFRGAAIFESKEEATKYLERYNQIMADKGRIVNLKVIEQYGLPPVNRPTYILSSQPQQPPPQQQKVQLPQQQQDENNDTTFLEE